MVLPGPADPFHELMQPPPDETSAQKTARLKRELDAQRVSDSIDEDIKQERAIAKKRRDVIKVLLLGQAESGEHSWLWCCLTLKSLPSGKSTTLKSTVSFFNCSFYNLFTLCLDFRMRYARAEWERERNGWRSVVQLNVVRSIITILNVIEAEMNGHAPADSDDDQVALNGDNKVEVLKFTDHHQLLMIRLAPLLGIETELRHRLGAGSEQVPPASNSMSATPFDTPSGSQLRRKPEVLVPSWKNMLDSSGKPVEISPNIQDTVTSVLAGCKEDMKALWYDKAVRLALKRRRLQLFDSAGLYGSHIFLHYCC